MHAIGDRLRVAELQHDPYPLFAQLRRDAPVWRLPGEEVFLVSTWALVAEATGRVPELSNHFRHTLFSHDDGTLGVLATGGAGPDVFAGADPPVHTAHRRIFFSELVQQKLRGLEPAVEALAGELLAPLLAAGGGDAAVGLAHPLPMQVVADLVIGFPDADLDRLRQWVFDGSRLAGGCLRLDEMAALSGQVAGLASWTAGELEAAVGSNPRGDVLGAAAEAVSDGRLTREEAAFTLMVLLGAGAETSTGLIGNAVAMLAARPGLQDELRADPDKVPAYVEEVLRFESPFRFHPRTASGPVELAGVEIPDGALVLLLWSSANRDEKVFEEPDSVRLDRGNSRLHVGFGRGIHHCVGAPLARLEARVVLTELLRRTRSFRIDPGQPQQWADSVWIRRLEHLPLVIDPATRGS